MVGQKVRAEKVLNQNTEKELNELPPDRSVTGALKITYLLYK